MASSNAALLLIRGAVPYNIAMDPNVICVNIALICCNLKDLSICSTVFAIEQRVMSHLTFCLFDIECCCYAASLQQEIICSIVETSTIEMYCKMMYCHYFAVLFLYM